MMNDRCGGAEASHGEKQSGLIITTYFMNKCINES